MNMLSLSSRASMTFGVIGVSIISLVAFCGAEEPKVAVKASYKLEFTSNECYVVIPKLRYDGTYPITLEARVTPFERNDKPPRSSVIGNLELAGVGLHYRPAVWMFHVNHGSKSNAGYATAASENAVINSQVHIAGVYDGENVRLFIDGKLQDETEATTPHKMSPFDFMVGADPNRENKPHQFFRGTIDEVRISKVARYDQDFTPSNANFTSDESTLVLYHFDEGEGKIAYDASANKTHGEVHGAKWIPETK